MNSVREKKKKNYYLWADVLQIVYVLMLYLLLKKKNVFRRNPYPGSGLIAERIPQTQEIAPHSDEVILKHVGDTRIPKKKESSNANLNLGQHIADRVVVPLNQKVGINMVLT